MPGKTLDYLYLKRKLYSFYKGYRTDVFHYLGEVGLEERMIYVLREKAFWIYIVVEPG